MNEPIPLETDFSELEEASAELALPPAAAPAPVWASGDPAPAWMAAPLEPSELASAVEDPGLPPERVRFSAPLVVMVPGIDEPIDGVIVNLSEAGLACVLPLALHVDERITCRFRPTLGEEHVSLDGEVVWRRRAGGQDSLYGVRLVEVPAAVRGRLREVVRERVEGRAGEWPLPVVPAVARRPRPYVAVAVGIAIGAVLSLGISLVPTFLLGHGRPAGTPAVAALAGETRHDAAPAPELAQVLDPSASVAESAPPPATPAVLPITQDSSAPAGEASSAAASRATVAVAPAVTTVQSSPATRPPTPAVSPAEARASAPAASSPGPGRAAPIVAPNHSPAPARDAAVARKLEAVATARALDLTVPLDRPASGVKTFWLDNPRRFVIDVHGARSALDATEYPIPGSLAKRLRVGLHGDRVRFVVEATSAAASTARASASGSTVVVHLDQR